MENIDRALNSGEKVIQAYDAITKEKIQLSMLGFH